MTAALDAVEVARNIQHRRALNTVRAEQVASVWHEVLGAGAPRIVEVQMLSERHRGQTDRDGALAGSLNTDAGPPVSQDHSL